MTAQIGWIGRAERLVNEIVPVFMNSEKRDKNDGTNIIRNNLGQSFLALAYQTPNGFHRSYDLVDTNNSLDDWSNYRLSHLPESRIVMATITRVANLNGHAKIPAVTYRETDNHKLIIGTTGSATECAKLLEIQSIKGDTEDISDWIVRNGLENISQTLEQITQVPCNMNMVFTLVDKKVDDTTVYLLRSKSKTPNSRPYLSFSNTNLGLVYSSLPEEASHLMSKEYQSLKEESVATIKITK